MPLADLPDLIVAAAQETVDKHLDTLQIFRRDADSSEPELVAWPIGPDAIVKEVLVVRKPDIRVYFDIVRGYDADDLAQMVFIFVEIYHTPTHLRETV
jgi:hypothetical protein